MYRFIGTNAPIRLLFTVTFVALIVAGIVMHHSTATPLADGFGWGGNAIKAAG